jgi:DNA-directed RNA polymerase specialized sigma24 family protein
LVFQDNVFPVRKKTFSPTAEGKLTLFRNVGMKPSLSDPELIHAAPAGDLAAFEELTPRPERRNYLLAYRLLQSPHDAEEVTQPAFLGAEKHHLVFMLCDVQGLSVKESAPLLGLSEANVKVRLLRARLQLREHVTRTLGDPATRIIRPPHHHE